MKNRRDFIKTTLTASGALWLGSYGKTKAAGVLPSKGDIMAIAAHPGDGFFTMAAAVASQTALGAKGKFLSLSLGERGHSTILPPEYGQMQQEAAVKAATKLGAEAAFLSYADGEVPFNEEASLKVCDEIRRFKPSIVITHWKGSWHKDHRNCHQVVEDAIFYAGLKTLKRDHEAHYASQLFYAENWEDMDYFKQDTYLDITGVFSPWVEACSLFPMWRGETGFRYHHYYQSLATMRGCLSGFTHAVALMSPAGQQVRKLKTL